MNHEELARICESPPSIDSGLRIERWRRSRKTRTAITQAAGECAREQMGEEIHDDLCFALHDHCDIKHRFDQNGRDWS
jgi:hypothetical protein